MRFCFVLFFFQDLEKYASPDAVREWQKLLVCIISYYYYYYFGYIFEDMCYHSDFYFQN